MFPMKRGHHRLLLDPQKLAVRHCSRGSHTESLACQRAFPKKIPLTQYSDRGFLASLRHDGEPDFTFLDIEDSIRLIPLSEDRLLFRDGQHLSGVADHREESVGVELAVLPNGCSRAHRQ